MKIASRWFMVLCVGLAVKQTVAAPPNTVTLDGKPIEYDAGELRGFNPLPANNFGAGNVITNLFLTWDESYLYVALQGREVNDKLTLMLDVDPGNGTGATSTTNWTSIDPAQASFIKYNDVGWSAAATSETVVAFGVDYQVATEGFYNNLIRIRYNGELAPDTNNVEALFDVGNGATPQGTPVDMVVLANASTDPLKGMEARIPWSELYASNYFGVVTNVVPDGARIRMFAVLHNNDPSSAYSSDGIIPAQTNIAASYTGGVWVTADYIDVVVDQDNDGAPDVASGDVNAPYLRYAGGVQAKRQVYASFNEPVTPGTATTVGNWLVNEQGVSSVAVVATNAVLISLTNDLPAAGTLVKVEASNITDASANARTSIIYFDPASSGIETSVTVRFLLNKNSGFGFSAANPRATTNFFINGNAAPLEWGYPPAISSPLSSLNATQYYRDVVFPPGSPISVRYKYSGVLDGGSEATGLNNYEAIRFSDFGEAARILTLPLDGSSLVVTDFLGAAAAPLRLPNNATNAVDLYNDLRRSDAGVRQDAQVLFQLNLSQRNLGGVTRVMLLGSDPLRGFNFHPDYFGNFTGLSDYPGSVDVAWADGGLPMYDDGTNGDVLAGDGIYSRLCDFTTDGTVAGVSLVGGDVNVPPYAGFWTDGRSPRSFDYKFAVYKAGTDQSYISPLGANLSYYLGASETSASMPVHLWENEGLPPPPPTNSPTLVSIQFTNEQRIVNFAGTDLSHGVQISTNLIQGWMDFGTRAVTSSTPGLWRATITNVQNVEHYLAFAGLPKPAQGYWFEPNPVSLTGGVVRVWYRQHSRSLAGMRNVGLTGTITTPPWSTALPMRFFGDGVWYYDITIPSNSAVLTEVKPRSLAGDWEGGPNLFIYRGDGRATWSPNSPTNGGLLSIVYNANGGPLAASSSVNAWLGYDEGWSGASAIPMTNQVGQTNIWELAISVPTNYFGSVNFVFNSGGTTWDSEGNPGNGGRAYRAFINPRQFP